MSRRLSYFSTQAVVCLAASFAVGSMLGLEGEQRHLVSMLIFGVLMVFSASVAPEDEADAKRHAAEAALLTAYNNRCNEKNSDSSNSDGSGD
jgi:hypothetical protein